MKSKVALEVLREQLTSSLDTFSRYTSTEDILVRYTFSETEKLSLTVKDKPIKAYGLVLQQITMVGEETNTRKLWLRRYPIVGSLNEVKYQAFKELFDVIIGNFIVNATRTDNKTLEDLSNTRDEEVSEDSKVI